MNKYQQIQCATDLILGNAVNKRRYAIVTPNYFGPCGSYIFTDRNSQVKCAAKLAKV